MNTALVFDIETRVDRAWCERPEFLDGIAAGYEPPKSIKDPVKLAAHHTDWWEKQRDRWNLSPLTGCIYAIAWADLWEGDVECLAGADEVDDVLGPFVDTLNLLDNAPVLTGYNVRGFDVPWITARCSVLGLQLPRWWPHAKDYRGIADVMDATGGGRLCEWLERCGLPAKTDDGSQVEHMTVDQVRAYCTNDVAVERELARRFAPNIPGLRPTVPVSERDLEVPL